jgi:NADPH:quinone reductase
MSKHGGPEVLHVEELPDPVAGDGEVLVRVRAFSLNHADSYVRSGVWRFGVAVLGIEAAGVVEHDPSGGLSPRTPVVAVVGGMVRTRNGSYAELVSVPTFNVVPVRATPAARRCCASAAPTRSRSTTAIWPTRAAR